ncbi:MAG: NADP-dependent malic enzyme [Bacteroidetes bacterium HGW-Bacteroidetes-16]|jgi:malate dehydrogenase (oxaloacetate-decarboxylating)(NADP+)|nr:MAG: NADP-dependent malic enzyme [Bacteroidetes bacterium HGW-Bacteroidetes-16]
MDKLFRKDAFNYHALGRPGKIEVVPTKPYTTQRDLSLAYTPGVADPCLAIEKNPEDVYKYTAKGNLVAVISNGTAVLGLGNIGPEAGKPVMEGKGLLFKVFADIDVFDIEVNETDTEKFIQVVKAIAPTFGGINLEDIKAPECFEIEERLKKELNIPIMHDDQHGTAIITSAGLLNALKINKKKIENLKIVVNGAGAAAVSCTRLYIALGAKPENIIMLDSRGVLHKDRSDLNTTKLQFVVDTPARTLEEALVGADMFLGLSVGGVLKKNMLLAMADDPIVFALANPNPEITYDDATETRKDIIMATGRSDYPNQINNVLGFPFIFRGALDVRANTINEEMKLAASKALAELAQETVPEEVNLAFKVHNLTFGREYIIPKPTDPRLIERVAPAVARAAMESGVAAQPITDWDQYRVTLQKRLGLSNPLKRQVKSICKSDPKRILLADAESYTMLKAAEIIVNEKLALPILIGDKKLITNLIRVNELDLGKVEIIDPNSKEMLDKREAFAQILYKKRNRRGMTIVAAREALQHKNYFSLMLLETGMADGMISGLTRSYPDSIRPALQVIGKKTNTNIVSGMYIINTKSGPLFLSDCTVNLKPSTEELVEITLQTAEAVKRFKIEPRIAMLSYSNFGTVNSPLTIRQRDAIAILHRDYPELIVDGEMQANTALNEELLKGSFPFSKLNGVRANTLIFPTLGAANIAYKLLQELAGVEVVGPILNGMNKPVHVLQMGSGVNDIVSMIMIAALDAINK